MISAVGSECLSHPHVCEEVNEVCISPATFMEDGKVQTSFRKKFSQNSSIAHRLRIFEFLLNTLPQANSILIHKLTNNVKLIIFFPDNLVQGSKLPHVEKKIVNYDPHLRHQNYIFNNPYLTLGAQNPKLSLYDAN